MSWTENITYLLYDYLVKVLTQILMPYLNFFLILQKRDSCKLTNICKNKNKLSKNRNVKNTEKNQQVRYLPTTLLTYPTYLSLK